jgi:homoserine dehydrogenase
VADEINSISGILNGTTNFMLSAMESEGRDYASALKQAQELGYAEADPTYDVEGLDARDKVLILAFLAFGEHLSLEEISTQGITHLGVEDFEKARVKGQRIKLLATISKQGKTVSATVKPVWLDAEDPLGQISGATNAVMIQSKNLGQTVLIGQGAGRYPTANAVVSDIVRIAKKI